MAEENQAEDNVLCYLWGRDGFSETTKIPDELEVRVNESGRVFFVDHSTRKTNWEHPILKKKYKVPLSLPYGWQRYKDQTDSLVFVDHLTETCSYIDPRLLMPAKKVFPAKFAVRSFELLNHRFSTRTQAYDVASTLEHCEGKVVVITGGNSGIGFETAQALTCSGAQVIIACRNAIKAEAAVKKIQAHNRDASIQAMHLDLASLHSVSQFAVDFKAKFSLSTVGMPTEWGVRSFSPSVEDWMKQLHLDYLILNAAVFGLSRGTTVDGVEQHFGVNHLGHFCLFRMLEDLICRTPARVLVVSSEAHLYPDTDSECLDVPSLANPPKEEYSPILAYGASKLCNILFALEINRKYSSFGVTCNAIHPGNLLYTNLSSSANIWYKLMYTLAWPFSRSVSQAAASVVFVACHSTARTISGVYFNGFSPSLPSAEARYPTVAADLWRLSDSLLADKLRGSGEHGSHGRSFEL